jgi:TolB-like protein/Flp pilus assembly protein TadD
MASPLHAVFLSYASEDAEAAQHIADALRAAGVQVWFDRSELRGGDAWDRNIRDQIHHCRLFLPIISAKSEARDEGYFRREWKLAVDRTHDMAERRTFLVPVVIDGTPERGASVPERFLEVQWTRLPGGNADAAFVERVKRLLTSEVASSPPSAAIPGPVARTIASRPSRRKLFVGAAAVVAVIALIVVYIAHGRRGAQAPGAQAANSIAVLPLANESGDPSQQYFSDGLSENLITALTQFPALKVIGRTSAFQFRDSKEDAQSIGAKLGVSRLLEGSVQRSGETVRVRTELIDAADGSTQWSERYDRPYKDLFALQDEISRAVVAALRTRLLPNQHAAAQKERPPSGNLEAYNALLQGRFHFSRNTEDDYRKAIDFFTEATRLDPSYALAWSGLSSASAYLGSNYLAGAEMQEAWQRARVAADRALTLSPDLAEAHLARGDVLRTTFDWLGAEAEYRRALELAPSDGEAMASVSGQLGVLGDANGAVDLMQQAITMDPLRDLWYADLAGYLMGSGRLNEAESAIRRAIELQPSETTFHCATLVMIEVQKSNAPAALGTAQQCPSGPGQIVALAFARQIGSNRVEADAALKALIKVHADDYPYIIASLYALRNDADAMFKWLERAGEQRDPGIGWLLLDPFIPRYKNDPRFAVFCRKVGLPAPGEKRTAT